MLEIGNIPVCHRFEGFSGHDCIGLAEEVRALPTLSQLQQPLEVFSDAEGQMLLISTTEF